MYISEGLLPRIGRLTESGVFVRDCPHKVGICLFWIYMGIWERR